MFLWSNIAYHCSSKTSDYGCADSRCDVVVCRGNVCGQWAERVERSFVASFLSRSILAGILFIGTCPGPSISTCTSCSHAFSVSSPEHDQVPGTGRGRWHRGLSRDAYAVAERNSHVVFVEDFADFVEMGIEEAFLVVDYAPLGHD